MASQYNGYSNGKAGAPDSLPPAAKKNVRPDGFPVLPPIKKPENPRVDPYANSKLLTYRLAKTQKSLLMKILYVTYLIILCSL